MIKEGDPTHTQLDREWEKEIKNSNSAPEHTVFGLFLIICIIRGEREFMNLFLLIYWI